MNKSASFGNCGKCPFYEEGRRNYCRVYDIERKPDDYCCGYEVEMKEKHVVNVLHTFQKYRRGCFPFMPNPVVIGAAIDIAIRKLRQQSRYMKLFSNKAGEGYNKDRIFIAARNKFEAIRVCNNSKTKHTYPDKGWFQVPHTHTECDEPTIIMED